MSSEGCHCEGRSLDNVPKFQVYKNNLKFQWNFNSFGKFQKVSYIFTKFQRFKLTRKIHGYLRKSLRRWVFFFILLASFQIKYSLNPYWSNIWSESKFSYVLIQPIIARKFLSNFSFLGVFLHFKLVVFWIGNLIHKYRIRFLFILKVFFEDFHTAVFIFNYFFSEL